MTPKEGGGMGFAQIDYDRGVIGLMVGGVFVGYGKDGTHHDQMKKDVEAINARHSQAVARAVEEAVRPLRIERIKLKKLLRAAGKGAERNFYCAQKFLDQRNEARTDKDKAVRSAVSEAWEEAAKIAEKEMDVPVKQNWVAKAIRSKKAGA